MTKQLVSCFILCSLAACGGAPTSSDGPPATTPDGGIATGPGVTPDEGAPLAQDGGSPSPPADGSAAHPSDAGMSSSKDAAEPQPTDGAVAPPVVSTPGAPTTPTEFTMTNEGPNDAVMTWKASMAGTNPIDHYEIYRNGVAYASTKNTTYTDSAATTLITPGGFPNPYIAAKIYRYTVSAVDTKGKESARQTALTAWVYHAGLDNWTLQTDNYNDGAQTDDKDTSGAPQSGSPTDIKVTVTGGDCQIQPYSGPPFLHNVPPSFPIHAMELGSFDYMTLDLKPTRAGQTWRLNIISRVTIGDNYNSAEVILGGADQTFGPQAKAGVWATYRIPFLNPVATDFSDGKALQVGVGTYEGSISGTMLTVTKMLTGLNVQGSSYLSGGNIIQGTSSSTTTYIATSNNSTGMTGSYTVAPSQNVPNITITAQRTNMYKFSLNDQTFSSGNVFYVDNIGFAAK